MRPNRILQLLNQNRTSPRRFEVEASKNADEATIYLYDMIVDDDWWGGVSAQSFVQTLASITAPTIHLRVNSPGGDVFAARAMEAAIRGHQSKVIAHVDGWALSAASFLIMGADEREIAEGAFLMIHNAWTIAMGNAQDMQATASLLEKIDSALVKTYVDATGLGADQIAAWMSAETWFTADEAVEHGFVNRKAEYADKTAQAAWNLSAFANAPKGGKKPAATPAPAPANSPSQPDRDAMHRAVLAALIPA